MSITCKEITDKLNELAPAHLADSWDNVGFLIGNEEAEVKKVLVALDATLDVVQEAVRLGAQMIVTHHPMMLEGLKQINSSTIVGQKVMQLVENGIALYSAHTNLDGAKEGLSTLLGHTLELKNRDILKEIGEDGGIGQIGELESMSLRKLCHYIKDKLGISHLRLVGDPERVVSKIATSPGSSMYFAPMAYEAGAEVFITGDLKYHDAQDYKEKGMALIDAGHYGTEHIVVYMLADLLKEWFEGLEVIIAKEDVDPFRVL